MVKFIKGCNNHGMRINEWNVDGSIIKTTFQNGSVKVIEGIVSEETVNIMQNMVDESVRIAEGY